MVGGTWIRSLVLPLALGGIWPFVVAELFAFSGRITVPLLRLAHDLGLDTNAQVAVRVVDAVLWAVILGGLFGVPLALSARRRIAVSWIAFLVGVLAVDLVLAMRSEAGIGVMLLAWSIPEMWLYVLAVLGAAYCILHLHGRKGAQRAIAP